MSAIAPGAAPQAGARARPGALDVVGFVLAIVVPLAGLIVSLVALGRARARQLRAPALAVAAIPVSIVLLVLQVGGGIGGALLIGHAVAASEDAPECRVLAEHLDLLADDGPASLDGLTEQAWTARRSTIGTWHSELLDLGFALPDGMAGTDPLAVAVQSLSDRLDPATGWSGKDWSTVSADVRTIRDWRAASCG